MLKLKLQPFGHLTWRADSLEKTLIWERLKAKGEGAAEDEMVGWHHQLSGYEFEQTLGIEKDRKAWRAAVHGVAKKSDTTERLNNNVFTSRWPSSAHLLPPSLGSSWPIPLRLSQSPRVCDLCLSALLRPWSSAPPVLVNISGHDFPQIEQPQASHYVTTSQSSCYSDFTIQK